MENGGSSVVWSMERIHERRTEDEVQVDVGNLGEGVAVGTVRGVVTWTTGWRGVAVGTVMGVVTWVGGT